MPKGDVNGKPKLACSASKSAPLRRSHRLLGQYSSGDAPKTPPSTENQKAPSSITAPPKHSVPTSKTRSFCKTAISHLKDLDEKHNPSGPRRRSPRFSNLDGDSGVQKPLELPGGRRRSPRLAISREEASSGGSNVLDGIVGNVEMDRKRRSTSIQATPLRNEGGKRRRVGKRKLGDGVGIVKLGSEVESEEERLEEKVGKEEEEFALASIGEVEMANGFGRMEVCQSVQIDKFSTPKVWVDGKGKKSRCCDGWRDSDLVVGFQVHEWTSEQDDILQRAYLRARPSPHFWKKVSKMVPGKSAKECFDRIHSKFITPPISQRQLRRNKCIQSPISHVNLSGSNPATFFNEIVKNVRSKKQRKLIAQRTVRHMLRKHFLADRGREADLFPVFQACMDTCATNTVCSDTSKPEDPALSSWVTPNSIGNPLKAGSLLPARIMFSDKERKTSPEILRKVRNPALHEKYIDQLSCRDAGWRVSTKKTADTCKTGLINAIPKSTVKDAKSTLLSEAREVIMHYQHSMPTSDHRADTDDENYYGSCNGSDVEEA